MIPKKWAVETLGDVISYKKGFAFKSANYSSRGKRIIRISDTTEASIKDNDQVFTKPDIALSDYELNAGDIILSTVGSRPPHYASMVGKAIRVPSYASGSYLNQNLVKIKPKDEIINSFLFIKLKEISFIYYIATIARGNANQASITLEDLFCYQLLLPPLSEQNKIAEILTSVDRVIELTTITIKKLIDLKKGMMQELFTKGIGHTKFKDSPVGKIPESWEVSPLKVQVFF